MSISASSSQAGRTRRFVPLLEELGPRCLPAASVRTVLGGAWDGGNLLAIRGGIEISIVDTGARGAGHLSVTCDSVLRDTPENYSEIYVATGRINNNVGYRLTGDLRANRRLDVNLAGGNDFFSAVLFNQQGDAADIRSVLSIKVNGGPGRDNLQVIGNYDPDVTSDGGLFLAIDGGPDNDTIRCLYNGEVKGEIGLSISGSAGRDFVRAFFTFDIGSTGRLGRFLKPAVVRGGDGNDTLRFLVQNDGGADVFAELYGDNGIDDLSFTANVDAFP